MLKMKSFLTRSIKYLTIVLANGVILTLLLALWTDALQLRFDDFVRPLEFLKILGFSTLSLVIVWLYSRALRKKGIVGLRTKLSGAIILTLLTSSYLYVGYTQRVISNVLINGSFRAQIATKIKPGGNLANGSHAKGLTGIEYQLVARLAGFPSLPPTADNIGYSFGYDGFLPDYSLTLTYDVPPGTPIREYNKTNGRYSTYQSATLINTVKRVSYSESLQ